MVTDERLAHYIEYADLVGDNGTPAISTGELASMARELQSLRASIPGGVGVEEIAKMVDPLAWSETYPNGYKTARKVALERAARILSALDLPPAEGEPVGFFRKTDGAWKHVPDEWSDHPNVQPLYAAPSDPVIPNDMVERVFQAVAPHIAGTDWREVRDAITAALSEKPQSDGDHHEQ